jgi:hypothetical protein
MSGPNSRLVVRTYAPLRGWLLAGGAVVVALLSLYVAFEWGRSTAGFDGRGARAEHSRLMDQIHALEAESHRQRLELASQETARVGQTRERAELAKSIGDLQAQVARQAQDLAFYRGIVGENMAAEVLRIQEFRVTRGAKPDEYLLHLVLGRPLRPEDSINGTVRMTFEGTTAATPVNLDLGAVSSVPGGELRFSYRYVQTLDQAIKLPPGFMPARTTIDIAPARKGANPVRQSFIWTVEGK